MKYRLVIFFALTLALVACSRGGSPGAILSPDDLPEGIQGPTVRDITATSATIAFTSDTPLICVVAYGTDLSYGTLDQMDMMEGAVRDHRNILEGLAPDTMYHYRLTMVDEQGRIYQTGDRTFDTLDESTSSEPKDDNLASLAAGARVIGVSSNFGKKDDDSSFGANKALDGKPNTAWSSHGDGDDAWIEIELPGTYDVTTIGFWTRTMSNNTAQIFQFTVTTDTGETAGPFDLPDADQMHTFSVELTARTLRFDAVETNTGNTGAVEITVYGTPHQ